MAVSLSVFAYLMAVHLTLPTPIAEQPTNKGLEEEVSLGTSVQRDREPVTATDPSVTSDCQTPLALEYEQKALSAILKNQLSMAEVDAKLPHMEDEYEAWARKEYPHIMWLYDVLMGRIPTSLADSSASRTLSFGVDDSGAPTITLPGEEGIPITFAFVLPDGWPKNTALWDGVPANIPEWAQRLFADLPEPERPTGWRALLVYSGEIFKFDHPKPPKNPTSFQPWKQFNKPPT